MKELSHLMTDDRWQKLLERGKVLSHNLSRAVFGDDAVAEPIGDLTWQLWSDLMKQPPRAPDSLLADAFYIVCKMTGNRVSVVRMKAYTKMIFGRPLRVIPRSKTTKQKWPVGDKAKKIILSHIPDDDAYEDLVKEW